MFQFLIYIIVFIFGTIIGSFLNCVIYRLEESKSFLKGFSFCPNCKHRLYFKDLIPLISFFTLNRKCHYCKKPISWQYPIIEFLTGIIFLLIYFLQGLGYNEFLLFDYISLFYYWIISGFLIVIFIYDLKHFIILDKVLFSGIIVSLVFNLRLLFFNQFQDFLFLILSIIVGSGFFLSIYLISKGKWIGFGDVKLAIFLGLILSWPKIILALFLSFFIGGIIGIGLIYFKKKGLKSEIPFAPFLITGTFLTIFWGDKILNWYFSFFI